MDLKYLNAVNILTSAKIGALQKIYEKFNGDFEKAWNSNIAKFLPQNTDYPNIKNKIDPEREIKLLKENSIEIITIFDKEYPDLLKQIVNPPFILYIKGDKDVLSSFCFGIVGTRSLTDYGKQITPRITKDIARVGLVIVSGLAMGIDTLAHNATLDAGQKTIAVLGCGLSLNVLYPPQNRKLADDIIKNGGAIISEYSFNMSGSKITFPQRNRIISGLSKGVLIVEADIQSGALITARCATEQNREVFCVPGNVYSKYSEGTNLYIQKGAKLVTSSKDILTEFQISYNSESLPIKADNEVEEKILKVLSNEPIHIDDIIRQSGLDTSTAQSTLIIMELDEKIKNLGDNKFVVQK